MSVPELVRERLGDEDVRAQVPLGGDDTLVVTATRTLVYRGEGLLSGETVEEFPHDVERVAIDEGRRKSTITLDHGLDGESSLTVPADRLDEVLRPVFGGVLIAAEAIDPDEAIRDVHRLGELTVVITDGRVIKHIGGALWEREEFEEYAFERVTGLEVEQGDVSSQIIVEVERRPQRIKTPSDDTRMIREGIERSLLEYHGVDTYAEFERQVGEDDDADTEEALDAAGTEANDASSPDAEPDVEPDADAPEDDAGMVFEENPGTVAIEETDAESSGSPVDVAAEVAALREAVQRQNELLEDHHRAIEQLVEELRRGR